MAGQHRDRPRDWRTGGRKAEGKKSKRTSAEESNEDGWGAYEVDPAGGAVAVAARPAMIELALRLQAAQRLVAAREVFISTARTDAIVVQAEEVGDLLVQVVQVLAYGVPVDAEVVQQRRALLDARRVGLAFLVVAHETSAPRKAKKSPKVCRKGEMRNRELEGG